jgi:hypothetical protein
MTPPRDFIREPAPWAPLEQPGRATFDELQELLDDHHDVALVGQHDAEMGPYSRCIIVKHHDVPRFHGNGFRALTRREYEGTWAKPDPFVGATD